jgi:hypothetical protein
MKLLKAFGLVLGGALVAWASVFFALYLLAPRDAAPPQDDDVLPALKRIPDEQNAVNALLDGASKLELRNIEPRRFLEPQNWSSSEAGRLTTANEAALKLFEAALKRPQSLSLTRRPEFESLEAFQRDAIPARLLDVHRMAELMLVRAELKLRASDHQGAWQDMLTVARVGAKLRQAHGILIEHSVWTSFERLALDRMRVSLERSRSLNASAWRERLTQLSGLDPDPNSLREALKTEYRYQRLNVEALRFNPRGAGDQLQRWIASADPPVADPLLGLNNLALRLVPVHYAFAPNRTLNELAARTRTMMALAGVCQPPAETAPTRLVGAWQANSVGQNLIALIAPRIDQDNPDCALRLSLAVLETEMALRVFQLEQGSLPPVLEALSPAYLRRLPFDPYTNPPKPLQYDARQKNLRSQSGLLFQIKF